MVFGDKYFEFINRFVTHYTESKKLEIGMRAFYALITLVLVQLFTLSEGTVKAQTQSANGQGNKEIIGIWGMFKDRHPDGWGSWRPPYEYLEFKESGKYSRTYINKKGNTIMLGSYKVIDSSIIIFYENTATDGIRKQAFPIDTARLYSVKADVIEIWEDWDRIFWKKDKKWGHKKKYRPLTQEEKQKIELVTTKIINDYTLIKDTDGNGN
jgi:hypothetical protein